VLATADSDGNTYLWDWASGKMTGTLTDPDTEGVEAVAVSPGGTVLAACDASGSAYLWHF
jgi:WD40 repeat protein